MTVVAVLCSDIHLSHDCPPARAAEPRWFAAMKRSLDQLCEISLEVQAPIFCAGDVFDKWRSCPELINFAMQNLPDMYTVPGQHDLPYHNYEDREKSAYYTLVLKGIIDPLDEGPVLVDGKFNFRGFTDGQFNVNGFSWGQEWGSSNCPARINMLVAHRYVWQRGSGYPGAPNESQVGRLPSLEGYDVAVFGDNHQPFVARNGGCLVVNPGCLIPRKSDERSIQPGVFLLKDDLTVVRRELDTSQDKWIDKGGDESLPEVEPAGMKDFLAELRDLDADSLDFAAAVRRYCDDNKVGKRTERLILESMGEKA